MRVFVFVWGTELQRDSNVPLVVLYCSGAYSPFYIFIFCLQDSEKLLALCRSEGGQISLSLGLKPKRHPPSPWLVLHFHGGGFVAQTSKSHEVSLRLFCPYISYMPPFSSYLKSCRPVTFKSSGI